MTLTAYYKIGDGNRSFHVKASDYENQLNRMISYLKTLNLSDSIMGLLMQ